MRPVSVDVCCRLNVARAELPGDKRPLRRAEAQTGRFTFQVKRRIVRAIRSDLLPQLTAAREQ